MSEKDNPLTEAFFYILLSLRHSNHGYGVIQEVEELTKGRVSRGGHPVFAATQKGGGVSGGGHALRSVADHAEARMDPRGEPGD